MKYKNKSILITGCSSGIGFETAVYLSENGWNVIATCRKEKDVKKINNLGITCFQLDYSSEKSIDTALKKLLVETDGRLEAVFNNGAFALPGAIEDIPSEGMKEIFQTNFFGWHYLVRKIIPIMRKQGYGKIIQCSSILGFITLSFRGPYNATKWALEGYTDTLRMELEGSGINVISIRPGPIKTLIRENSLNYFKKWIDWENSVLDKHYKNVLIPKLKDGSDGLFNRLFELKGKDVAKVILKSLESKKPRFTYNITIPTKLMAILVRVLTKKSSQKFLLKFSENNYIPRDT
jgi:NAD(P)-dependent dehydrogenase (short-subunit alcohol dehydrogenase family)